MDYDFPLAGMMKAGSDCGLSYRRICQRSSKAAISHLHRQTAPTPILPSMTCVLQPPRLASQCFSPRIHGNDESCAENFFYCDEEQCQFENIFREGLTDGATIKREEEEGDRRSEAELEEIRKVRYDPVTLVQ